METTQNQISSIGAAWPPTLATNQRLRGFYTKGVVTSQQEADVVANHIDSAVDEMVRSEGLSRLSVRVVSEIGWLPKLKFDRADIEAALPIRDTDLVIAYVGANQDDRQMSKARLAEHQALLTGVAQMARIETTPELHVEIVDRQNTTRLISPFTELYSSFGYDHSETELLLGDDNNIIAYHRVDGVTASTAMAEKARVEIKGLGELSLVEITEASTHPFYRQRGLYRAVSGYLIQHLVTQQREGATNIDVLYGESNLSMPGVVIAAQQNGRRFSYFDRSHLGCQNVSFGILPQNFAVADGTETRKYNDFAVSYVPLTSGRN